MNIIKEFAPAKLNLYLHVTGRQENGYHDLDSLVAFATIGDLLTLTPSSAFSFTLEGPQAASLRGEDVESNLAVKAARSLAEMTGNKLDVALVLTKNLPVASGIGGGSSDAAAALRALARYWGLSSEDPRLAQAAGLHGQDVPVCLKPSENNYMTATGVIPAPRLPQVAVVLANPNHGLPTPAVFKEFKQGNDPFSPLRRLEEAPATKEALVADLSLRSNDLYAPACRLMPEVADIVAALAAEKGCMLSRMSGSGATCFGLYESETAAEAAAVALRQAHPAWWVEAGVINKP